MFIRELISNASDALEKYRHLTLTNQVADDPNIPLEVNVYTDPVKKTITIQDTGIGMVKEELVKNLGSIGHSGLYFSQISSFQRVFRGISIERC